MGFDLAVVHEAVRDAVHRFLSPLDPDGDDGFLDEPVALAADPGVRAPHGWPLGKAVQRLELAAVANRVAGVRLVREVLIAKGTGTAVEQLTISGLELPRVRAIGVGAEADLDALRGGQPPSPSDLLPVPVVPDTC